MTPTEIMAVKAALGIFVAAGGLDIIFSFLPDSVSKHKGFILRILSAVGIKTAKKMYNYGRKDKIK